MVTIIKTSEMKNGKHKLRKLSVDRGRLQEDIIAFFKHYYVLCSLRGLGFTSGLLIFEQCEPKEIPTSLNICFFHL